MRKCDCCGFDEAEVSPFIVYGKQLELCDLCSKISAVNKPPNSNIEEILSTICFVGNTVLRAIKEK